MLPEDKAILVFGGTGGIGRAIIDHSIKRNLKQIVATYRSSPPHIPELVQWTRFNAGSTPPRELASWLDKNMIRLDSVIFTIGTPSSKRIIVDTPEDEWLSLYIDNCLSFVLAYQAIKVKIRENKGCVLVLSSNTTKTIGKLNGAYTAAKAALETVVVTLSKEEAPYGVRINALAPSLVDTPLADHIIKLKGVKNKKKYIRSLPWKRLIDKSAVAEAAVSIVLDSAWNYATGQIFHLASNTS
jgi:3-oxoacyl-[acyl-carrier protein] reductase